MFHPDDLKAAADYAAAYQRQYGLVDEAMVEALRYQHLVWLTNARLYQAALEKMTAAEQRRAKILRACALAYHTDLSTSSHRRSVLAEIEAIKAELGIVRLSDVAEFVEGAWVLKK